MKKGIRLISIVLAALMAVSLCACGKKESAANQEAATASKDYVYSANILPIQLGDSDVSEIRVIGDTIYALAYQYIDNGEEGNGPVVEPRVILEEEVAQEEAVETAEGEEPVEAIEGEEAGEFYSSSTTQLVIGSFHTDGSEISRFTITLPENAGMNGFSVDNNGDFFMVLDEYGKDTSNPDNVRDVYSLICYDNQGTEKWRTQLGPENLNPDEYYYVNQIMFDGNDSIILQAENNIEVYGTDGNKKGQWSIGDDNYGNIILLREGQLGVICYGENSEYLVTMDLSTGKKSDKITFPFNSYNYSYYSSGGKYDLLLTDSSGIYYFNLGDTEVTKIMDYVDSDLMTSNLYNITIIDETSFVANYYDEVEEKTVCAKFTKVPPQEVKDKEILTLGCAYLDYDVRRQVIAFNKANDSYRIKVLDYSQYNTEEDYSIAQTKLNTDIATGKIPDILLLSSDMPFESYVNKGVFADLNTFLEQDPELKREDFMGNVLDALSTDGKLYRITPSFFVFTVFGKTADVGSEPGWTIQDLQALMEKKGDGVTAFNDTTQSTILNYSMWLCSEQFIDWNTGKCSFDSDAFIELLEFAAQYPKEINYDDIYNDSSYWENYQTMYREGRALLMISTIANFEDYNQCEQGTFGEEITPIGFPTANKKGNAINASYMFAISSKSKNQQAAWEFVRYFLTDEFQDTMEYCWPIKRAQIEKMAQKAQQKPFYIDENGEKVEYDNTYYLNGVDVVIEPMTKEKADKLLQFIESVDQIMNYDSSVTSIIEEEAEPYFAGQKSAKEVADIIQSRVQIYVNENR